MTVEVAMSPSERDPEVYWGWSLGQLEGSGCMGRLADGNLAPRSPGPSHLEWIYQRKSTDKK